MKHLKKAVLLLVMLQAGFFLNAKSPIRDFGNSYQSKNCFVDMAMQEPQDLKNAAENHPNIFHLFSHGKPGQLQINGLWLNHDQLTDFISNILSGNINQFPTINIYGCNFGQGEKGKEAIDYLEKNLGIQINASTDLTGKNGNWILEIGGFQLSNLDYSYSLQLDTEHYLPPFVGGDYEIANFSEEEVVLTTNSTTSFQVTVTDGSGSPIPGSPFTIVKGSPVIINFPILNKTPNGPLAQPRSGLGSKYVGKGLKFTSTEKFAVSYRSRGDVQAEIVSAKGKKAKGKQFKWAVPRGFFGHVSVHSYLSIFAVENATVNISGIDPSTNITGISHSGAISISLAAGESVIYEVKGLNTPANISGHVGANISSTGDIVINTGGQNAQFLNTDSTTQSRDHAIDQIIPINNLGLEYITVQANGGNEEKVFLTATSNNTEIYLNGDPTAIAVLNDGDQFMLTGSTHWSANGTMYIRATKPLYVQHVLQGRSGGTFIPTQGMNFISPLSCFAAKEIDEIGNVAQIGSTTYSSSEIILIETVGATTTARQNGNVETLPTAVSVTGNPNYQIRRFVGLATGSNWSFISNAAVFAYLFGSDGNNVGYASYVSDFPDIPAVSVNGLTNSCGSNTFQVSSGPWSGYQWFKNGVAIPGATNQTYFATEPADYSVEVYFGVGSSCAQSSSGVVNPCPSITFPDFNSGFATIAFSGNVSTNDQIVTGSTYTAGALISFTSDNPLPAPNVTMNMNSDGSYSFSSDRPGIYVYNVSICPPGQSSGCPTENLTIKLLDNTEFTNPPIATTDISAVGSWQTGQNPTEVIIPVLSNDFAGDLTTALQPTSLTITSSPAFGTATVIDVNDIKGIRYQPAAGQDGIVVFNYEICDQKDPQECANGRVEVTVIDPNILGVFTADDYANTNATVPISGSVISNDLDFSTLTNIGLTVDPQSIDVAGYTLEILSNGNYSFTAKPGYEGTVAQPYTVCNSANTFCTEGTLYITVSNHITFDAANGWVAGQANGVPNEDDGNRNAYVFNSTASPVTNQVKVKNLFVASDAELRMASCLTVNENAQVLGSVRFEAIDDNGDGSNPPVYGRYLGPSSKNIIFEMSFSEKGWHNIAIPVTRPDGTPYTTSDLIADNNDGGFLPVAITGIPETHNLWRFDTEVSGGEELGFFIQRAGQQDLYESHSYGTQRMIEDLNTPLNNYGLNFYLDDFFTGFPTKLRVEGKVNIAPVTYTTHDNWGGWNLIPNPFPSLLDVDKLNGAGGAPSIFHKGGDPLDVLEFDQAIYIWDAGDANIGPLDGLWKKGSYVAFDVQTGLTVDPNFAYNPGASGLYIAPMQSFYLRRITASEQRRNNFGDPSPNNLLGVAVGPNQTSPGTDGSTNTNDQARITNTSATNGPLNITILPDHLGGCDIVRHFKKEWDVIMLNVINVANPQLADATELVFDEMFSSGLDVGYDIKKMSAKPNYPVLFSIIENKSLVINKMPSPKEGTTVPLGFYSDNDGAAFRFELPLVPAGWTVFIEDRKNDKWHNFANGAYFFLNDTEFKIERFRLHFKAGEASSQDFHPGIKAWGIEEGIKVEFHNLLAPHARIRITDGAGRILFNEGGISTKNNFIFPISSGSQGFYTITVITDNQIITEKVIR